MQGALAGSIKGGTIKPDQHGRVSSVLGVHITSGGVGQYSRIAKGSGKLSGTLNPATPASVCGSVERFLLILIKDQSFQNFRPFSRALDGNSIVATSCDRSGQLMSCLSQYQEEALEGEECPVGIMRDGSTPERVLSWSTSESSNPSSNTAALPCSKAS